MSSIEQSLSSSLTHPTMTGGGRLQLRRASFTDAPPTRQQRVRRASISALSSNNDSSRPSPNALRWRGRPAETSRRSIDQISPDTHRSSSPRHALAADLIRPGALPEPQHELSQEVVNAYRISESGVAGVSALGLNNTEFAGLAELGISFDVKAPKVVVRRATADSGYDAVVQVASGSPMCIEVLVEDLRELGLAMGCVQFSRGAREVTVFCTLAASHAADDAEKQRVLDSTGLAAIRARLRDTLESHHPCLGLSLMSIQLPKHATQMLLLKDNQARQAARNAPSSRLSSAAILLLWMKGGDQRQSQMSLSTEGGAKILSTVNHVLRAMDVQLSSGQLLLEGASGIASCSFNVNHRMRAVPLPMQRDVKAAVISALARQSQTDGGEKDEVAMTLQSLASFSQAGVAEVL